MTNLRRFTCLVESQLNKLSNAVAANSAVTKQRIDQTSSEIKNLIDVVSKNSATATNKINGQFLIITP